MRVNRSNTHGQGSRMIQYRIEFITCIFFLHPGRRPSIIQDIRVYISPIRPHNRPHPFIYRNSREHIRVSSNRLKDRATQIRSQVNDSLRLVREPQTHFKAAQHFYRPNKNKSFV